MGADFKIWGQNPEESALQQMRNACSLPVSIKGALMPDCHTGYGLPVGGVLATKNTVIPYAVGVDISCSVKISVFDLPAIYLKKNESLLKQVLEQQTRFGVGAEFKEKEKRYHPVMDEDWSVSLVTQRFKDKAWTQLGTSGSGNHFVEFGIFQINENDLGLPPGEYTALLSHSGSRGTGAAVCEYYSRLAQKEHPELPKELKHLAWLSLDSTTGQEYWKAMQLMHDYATANHELIHKHIAKALHSKVLFTFGNSHNLAWKETHYGNELIVHRKGATPADKGLLGIIPGSMASPTYLVRGKGNTESLRSCAHGAGRLMSRTQAKKTFNWKQASPYLKEKDVILLSAGIDEVPFVYKDIHEIMEAQKDLVDIIAQFIPKIVKMAPSGERPED